MSQVHYVVTPQLFPTLIRKWPPSFLLGPTGDTYVNYTPLQVFVPERTESVEVLIKK